MQREANKTILPYITIHNIYRHFREYLHSTEAVPGREMAVLPLKNPVRYGLGVFAALFCPRALCVLLRVPKLPPSDTL